MWAAPLAVLFVVWLWTAFSSGGFQPRQWLPAAMVLGLFGLVVSLVIAYPRRPGRVSLAVLAFFALYLLWVALSALWAESTTRVWLEATRTCMYLLVLALTLVFLTHRDARKVFRYLLMAAAFVLLAACVWRLWSAHSTAALFIENRFSYPVNYPNNAAALFVIGFWPLIWLAAGPEERAPVRGLALGLATGLLGLTVMTQSRGAIWSLALTVVVTFLVSPARLRTLLYLIVPGLLLVYQFPYLNRYWLEGSGAVGGALGARTLLVASIVAAVVGTLAAFVERRILAGAWVKTVRLKPILGGIFLVGTVAAVLYGAITLTSDAGGPLKWISQTWQQFSGQGRVQSQDDSNTRFAMLSSSGRVGIWQVAWKEFESAPVLGVGADNFIFEHDRLRTTEIYKPQHAHSIELQVLGETGVIGGVFAFGGILLALGSIMWPRCCVGWRGARATWLRRPNSRSSDNGMHSDVQRWDGDPISYGWEMALLVGVVYWIVHASVDWLWQMAGVSIPVMLFVAAGVARTDARAGIERPSSPEGLTWRFQAPLAVLSLLLIVAAGLPYLSLQYQRSALALAKSDGVRAIERAESARWLQPTDPGPYKTQGSIYTSAAVSAASLGADDRAGAVLDNLSLSIASYQDAIAEEPADWSLHYQAGVQTINLLLAMEYAAGRHPDLDYPAMISAAPGLEDWSALAGATAPHAPPGRAAGSLAADSPAQVTATYYRSLSGVELSHLALTFLGDAKERNPLASQVSEGISIVRRIQGN